MDLYMPVQDLLLRGWGFFLKFLAALIIFLIGWLVAILIKKAIVRILNILRIDSIAEQAKIADFLSRGGVKHTLSEIIGTIIYWVILWGVLISSLNMLALTGVSGFLDKILAYVPHVIGAIMILIVGIFISAFVASATRTAVANIGLSQVNLLSKFAQVMIIIFTILIALDELKIGTVLTSAMNIVLGAVGLGVALAFGLGCKDIAARFVSDLIDKLKKK